MPITSNYLIRALNCTTAVSTNIINNKVLIIIIGLIILSLLYGRKVLSIFLLNIFGLSFIYKDKTDHDTRIFNKLNEIINEDFIDCTLNSSLYNGWIFENNTYKINDYIRESIKIENSFKDKNLHKKHQKFLETLQKINDFLTSHFFPKGHNRYKLYPELTDNDEWGIYLNELRGLNEYCEQHYKLYRELIKKYLNK